MPNSSPIMVVDDDKDDQAMVKEALEELGAPNKIIFFERCIAAYDYLKNTTEQTFIIICDINLPGLSGLDFKRKIDDDPELRRKSIPFVFLSTAASEEIVREAYTTMTVQGFFKKNTSMHEFKNELSLVMEYWKLCKHPNSAS